MGTVSNTVSGLFNVPENKLRVCAYMQRNSATLQVSFERLTIQHAFLILFSLGVCYFAWL